jgi:hypothetical protein
MRVGAGGKWGPAREVHGGSGYWSQDSAVEVMGWGGPGPASEVEVRWPGGKVTRGPIPQGAHEIRVNSQGQVEKLR